MEALPTSQQMQAELSAVLQKCHFLSDLVRGSELLLTQISANLFSPESRPVTPLAEVVTRDTLKLACWRHAKTITSLSHYRFFHVLPLLDRGT